MKHVSIPIGKQQFLNIVPLNPLLSKCQIKVCYVGDEPNRNRSVITKEVATKMAASLPGSPIVGKYNNYKEDFEEHNQTIQFQDGKIEVVSDTIPYGFIPTDAKVWFQNYLDDGAVEREYLVTEGILWTGQYKEARRIVDRGNNQSMELEDEKYLDAHWTRDEKGNPQFFIVNDAVFSKLCILGEDEEPCFEGSQISRLEFSFGENFKQTVFSMVDEFKKLYEGGPKMLENNVEDVVTDSAIKVVTEETVEETVQVENPVIEEIEETTQVEDLVTEEVEVSEPEKPTENSNSYSLDENPEYIDLKNNYETLQTKFNELESKLSSMSDYADLKQFKLDVEDEEKDKLIKGFYMLSDEDKKDVIENKVQYSLEDIEAKLSVICVRNKVNFSLDEEDSENITTYSVDQAEDAGIPAWIKAVERTASKNI